MFRHALRALTALLACSLAASASPAKASGGALSAVPPPLQAWIPWALRDLGDDACPAGDEESRLCLALSKLEIRADKGGATFTLTGRRFSAGKVPLPGDSSAWPTEIRDGAAAIPVVGDPTDKPFVQRPAGPFQIKGRLAWHKRPSSVTIPEDIAVRNLLADGKMAAWDGENHRMWLEDRMEAQEANGTGGGPVADTVQSLQIRVLRILTDGSPMELTTNLQLVVGGKERRITFPGILPADARPLELNSELAGRLDAKGGLELTLRPGTWQVTVKSALRGTPKSFAVSALPSPWPDREVLSFQENHSLRALSLSGAPTVDPLQAGLDPSLRNLPTWSLDATHPLKIQVTRQGGVDPDSLRMELRRIFWLDSRGGGATVQDNLEIEAKQPLRLSFSGPFQAQRMVVNGQAQLVTTRAPGESGANLGAGRRSVEVLGRLSDKIWRSAPLSSTGLHLDRASVAVHAPPGWWILHLSGPAGGQEYGTWYSRWQPQDMVWAVVIAAAFFLAFGRVAGILALCILVLTSHDQFDLLPWLALAAVLLARPLAAKLAPGLPPRLQPLRRFSGAFATIILVWCAWSATGFSIRQWTKIVHPTAVATSEFDGLVLNGGLNWAKKSAAWTDGLKKDSTAASEPSPSAAPNQLPPSNWSGSLDSKMAYSSANQTEMRTVAWPASSPSAAMTNSVMDKINTASGGMLGEDDVILPGGGAALKCASIQPRSPRPVLRSAGNTGFRAIAVPNAPDPDKTADPFLEGSIQTGPGTPIEPEGIAASFESPLSPPTDAVVRIWAASTGWVRLIRLLGLGAVWSLLAWVRRARRKSVVDPSTASPAAMAPLGVLLLMAFAGNAQAQAAFPTEKMIEELRATLTKAPQCGDACVDISLLRLEARGREIRAQVTVEAQARSRVALPVGDWDLSDISCQNCAVGADGSDPWVVVEEGIQTVTLVARASGNDVVLSFPVRPKRLEVQAEGWSREDDGRASVHLVRSSGGKSAQVEATEDSPGRNLGTVPFARIQRMFRFGREWTATTWISRGSQYEGAVAISYPLLPGEVSVDGQATDSGKARWVLPAGARSVSFRTKLRRDDSLVLQASEGPWAETWRVEALARLQVVPRGIAPVGDGGMSWAPFPGEKLVLGIKAYPAVAGPVATLLAAQLKWTDLPQASRCELDLRPLVSQSTELQIALPENVRMGTVSRNGMAVLPTKLPNGKWSVPLLANTDFVHLDWQAAPGGALLRTSPRVGVSEAGVEFQTALAPDPSDFVWLCGGEGRGVRMMWWAFLPFFLLAAYGLRRWTREALGWGTCLLALIPLSTISGVWDRWELLALPALAGSLLWRARRDPTAWSRETFKRVQAGIALLAALACWPVVRLLLTPLQGKPDFLASPSAGPWTWVVDRSSGALPGAWILVLPLWAWKVAMALWLLWLARTSLPWIRKGWQSFGQGGFWPQPEPEFELESGVVVSPDEVAPTSTFSLS